MTELKQDEEVNLIVNYPKKAIRKLSVPIIISNLFMMLNNIIDGIWVAGLGPGQLAAVGFITPLFLAIVGFANGLGAGSNSLIARYIGAEDYESAGNSAIHSIVLSIVVTIITTVILFVFLNDLLILFGAKEVLNYGLAYGNIIILGIYSTFLPAMFSAIFRSQGQIKRASNPLILTAILNMILDPIFIYILDWGVAGAAFATVFAATISFIPMLYWMFVKKDSFLEIKMSKYKTNFTIYKDILTVGLPASLEQFIISFVSILINNWLTIIAGTTAVAAYTAAWRLTSIGISPAMGIGMAALTVGGAAYGARNLKNIRTTINYSIKLGLTFCIIVCVFFFIFAEPLSYIFSYSSNSAILAPKITAALRILSFFVVAVPVGVIAANIFQSMGKGTYSLCLCIIRTLIMESVFAALFAFVLNLGEYGLYIGLIVGMGVGSIISYIILTYYLRRNKEYFKYEG